jgi:hypothetical protein
VLIYPCCSEFFNHEPAPGGQVSAYGTQYWATLSRPRSTSSGPSLPDSIRREPYPFPRLSFIRNPFSSPTRIVPTGWQNANRLAARHFMTFTDLVDDPLLPNRKCKRIIIQR